MEGEYARFLSREKINEIEKEIRESRKDYNRKKECERCGTCVYIDYEVSNMIDLNELHIPLLPLAGDQAYLIQWCNECCTDEERATKGSLNIKLLERSWVDVTNIAFYNLDLFNQVNDSENSGFYFKQDICNFIYKNWARIVPQKKLKYGWETRLHKILSIDKNYTSQKLENSKDTLWYSAKYSEIADKKNKKKNERNTKKRKREIESNSKRPIKKRFEPQEIFTSDKYLAPFYHSVAPNYVYYPSHRQPLKMRLEPENTAPQIQIELSGFTCINEGGYRMARTTFPITSPGCYYFEVTIPKPFNGNIRLGWSTEKGDLQGPVGYDQFSFGYRNSSGQLFHRARGQPYGEVFGAGDLIGMLIKTTDVIEKSVFQLDLPKTVPKKKKRACKRAAPIISAKMHEPEEVEVMIGSEIEFFKNGKSQGVAFVNSVPPGTYYPAVSLYMGAKCTLNFGPTFTYPVTAKDVTPVCLVVPKTHPKPPVIPEPQHHHLPSPQLSDSSPDPPTKTADDKTTSKMDVDDSEEEEEEEDSEDEETDSELDHSRSPGPRHSSVRQDYSSDSSSGSSLDYEGNYANEYRSYPHPNDGLRDDYGSDNGPALNYSHGGTAYYDDYSPNYQHPPYFRPNYGGDGSPRHMSDAGEASPHTPPFNPYDNEENHYPM